MSERKARIREEMLTIPTYELGEEERLPIFYKLRINQGTRGDIYPYKNKDILTQELNPDHQYRALILENDYIRVTILPELGGRIYEGYDKVNDYHFVYKNNVIKPALIGLNGAWISGGIEFNWPQHHRPTTFLPVESAIEEGEDGSVTAWVGETESKNGQRSLLGITVRPDSSCITASVRLYNPTPQKEAFHWWSNLAVHVNDEYRLMFPPDIDYVTFHNKTHVSPFPVVKGEFAGVDYGEEGTDIRYVRNLQPAASFFIFDSAYSFMAGYDDSRDMGTVHVADRFISPGKKFFTWGKARYGSAWQKNLTDADGDYIEIMTGCYTDNQPDFTWIMPGETKAFEQCWYSLKGIRDLKNATKDAAVGVWQDGEDVAVSFNVTSPGRVVLEVNGHAQAFDAQPGQVYTVHAGHAAADDTVVRLTGADGRELVSWRKLPMFFEGKAAPSRRENAPLPEEIPTVDELFLNGVHTEQYKHALIRPEIYYLEGLKRDPGDLRCNTAMGILMYRRGDFGAAADYLEKAAVRAVCRNPNPMDTECLYQLGLARQMLGEPKAALEAFKRAAWGYAWKSAALLQAAQLEGTAGDFDAALRDLESCLETNALALKPLALRSALWIRSGYMEKAIAAGEDGIRRDPLDTASHMTLLLAGRPEHGETIRRILGSKTDAYLKLAEMYLAAGLYEEGKKALLLCPERTALLLCWLAWAEDRLGNPDACERCLRGIADAPQEKVFPNSPFDLIVLQAAWEKGSCAIAAYYLGCMYYARDNGPEAAKWWQRAVKAAPGFADAHRALALVMFEHYGDTAAARTEMEKALGCSREPRIFYEYYQLRKVLGASDEALLALLEENMDLVRKRQDLMLQYIELLCRLKRYGETEKLLATTKFYTYEGGEGHVPAIHAFVQISLGMICLEKGDCEGALEHFLGADILPEYYHEGPRYQESRAHIHYFKGVGYKACGRLAEAAEEFKTAASQRNAADQSQYYKGLALRELGEYAAAAELFAALKQDARRSLESSSMQFFLGFPAALPFEQSERRMIEKAGYAALFYAQLGLGETEAAKETEGLMQHRGISSLWTEYLAE